MLGQNPAAGGPNAGLVRAGLRKLKWLVVADWFETDTATFWKNDPTGPPPEEIGTEVFFIPAATVAGKGRLAHQHPAPDPVARQGYRPAG